MTATQDSLFEPIVTTGTPAQVGAAFGKVNAFSIRRHMADFMDSCRTKGLDEAAVIDRSAGGLQIIRKLTPYWEPELDAVAEAAQVSPELYKAFSIGKYRGLFFGQPECTSYAAAGSYVPFAGTTFHKSRDNVNRLQCAFPRRIRDTKHSPYAWCGTADTSDATTMMFVNEHGLAGSADTGGKADDFHGDGLMNTFGLRYIAEKCKDCQETLAALQEWSDNRYYAGGNIKTNWMFSDAEGIILRVVQDNNSIEPQLTREGIVMNCCRKRLESDLLRQAGYLDAHALTAASRINSVSMPSTISSLSVDCRPEHSDYLTCAWFALGRPTRAPYVPIFVASHTVPRGLLDGSLYRRSLLDRMSRDERHKMEAGWRARVEDCQEQTRELVQSDQTDNIRRLTQQVTADCLKEAFDNMPGDV